MQPEMNVTIYYFGFRDKALQDVAEALAHVLGIDWELRESIAHGGDYYRFQEEGNKSYWLQLNHTELLSWEAPNYPDYHLILRMSYFGNNQPPDPDDLLEMLSQIFDGVIFIPHDDLGLPLSLFKLLKIDPFEGCVLFVVYLITGLEDFWHMLLRVFSIKDSKTP